MTLQHMASNPFRTPDWRWQRAIAIRDGIPGTPPASRRRDGPVGFKWINKAVVFLREHAAASGSDMQRSLLAERRPDIFWARWARESQVNRKSVIEAQILARTDDHGIGYRCNMPPSVINAYESLFFNVREKLDHRSYILECVLGPSVHRGISEREHDILWKLYGYFLGPHIVDALEGKFANPMWCGTPTALGAAVMDDAISTLKMKAALAAKTVQVSPQTQLALMEAFTKFVEIERSTDSAGKAQEQVMDHIAAMMTTLPFNVGGRPSRVTNLSPIDAFEKTAIELTYEETMRLSVRQPIAHHKILQTLAFPVTESTQLEAPKS